jgi:hypothetical protein
MQAMDRRLAIRAALTQAAGVAVLSIALAIALPHSFFEDYGWIAGPGAWALCALVTAHALGLPKAWTLLGAAVAGAPSLIGVLLGAHWLGALVAIGVFAAWCGSGPPSPGRRRGGGFRSGTTGRRSSPPAPAPGPAGPGGR